MHPGVTPRVPQDNRSLKEQNDELNGQIINLSIQGARSLFSTAFSESLAAEISSVSRDEVTAPPPRAPRGPQASAVQVPGTNPVPHYPPSSWTPSRSRRRSTSGCKTTSTGSSWPSWRPTRPSWRSSSRRKSPPSTRGLLRPAGGHSGAGAGPDGGAPGQPQAGCAPQTSRASRPVGEEGKRVPLGCCSPWPPGALPGAIQACAAPGWHTGPRTLALDVGGG